MTLTTLCFVDCETTGLDDRIHQAYELCLWREDWDAPRTFTLPHTLEHADMGALRVGRYFERGMQNRTDSRDIDRLEEYLLDTTLVGANPGFDGGMMRAFLGTAVWHYRPICVSDRAAALFGWDRPRSLLDTAQGVRDAGYDIPTPDHTAEGDVRTTRAVYYALVQIAAHLRREELPA